MKYEVGSASHWSVTARSRVLAIVMTLAAVTLGGCDYLPFGYTPVKEVVAAPGQFEGREVKLKGRATGTLNLLGLKAFLLTDGTGEITVVTNGQLPAENAEVALRGTVSSAAIIGGSAIGLRVAETKRLR